MYKRILLATISLICFLIMVSNPVYARELSIVAGDLPPMITENGVGHEATIIKEVMAACGHTVKFRIVPFTRNWIEFQSGVYDAVSTVPAGMDLAGQRSVVYIRYQNGASVLASSGLKIHSLGDLAGKSVISFAGAREILPGLQAEVHNFADYHENTNQLVHSNLLFAGRVDAVLGDGLIFAEYNRRLREREKAGETLSFNSNQSVIFTAIFQPSPYVMVFKDGTLRDDFNRCFDQLANSGRVAAILKAAVEPYRATVTTQYQGY